MAIIITTPESVSHQLGSSSSNKSFGLIARLFAVLAAITICGILVWQGVAAAGAPDPTVPNTGRWAATVDIGVLVFREGLECVLVPATITASMTGDREFQKRPVAVGAAAGFMATLMTWFIAIRIVHSLTGSISALDLQAGTGLLAVVVLLVVMNWFFHKVYWGGWIAMHNRKKKKLLERAPRSSRAGQMFGLALLGFASLYREGLEVVLFLQSYYLKMGGEIVLGGAAIGLFLSSLVAILTFLAHRRLPYRKMLIFTGVMLGAVLLVMVGEQAQEMQLAHWIPTTPIPDLENKVPAWMGLWFSVFPTMETLLAQLTAAILVIGSYFIYRTQSGTGN